jgi:hypothetical protein
MAWEEFEGRQLHPFGDPEAGVYVVYAHRGEPKYVGSTDRLWDRLGSKHVAGDDGHAVQRAFSKAIPDRKARRAFLRRYLKVSYVETSTLEEAKALEHQLLKKYKPAWNIRGIAGRTVESECLYERYDDEYMKEYVNNIDAQQVLRTDAWNHRDYV